MRHRNWLLVRARRTPEAPALEFDGEVRSFAELATLARSGAGHVLRNAPADETPVALLLPGSADFAAWFHAIALAGRVVLPLNTRLTAGELARQLEDARVTSLIGDASDERLDGLARECPRVNVCTAPALRELSAPRDSLPGETFEPNATLAVLFTSGTTGRAKGACLGWNAFFASAQGAAARLGAAVAGRWLACMPLFHVGGLSILARSVLFGGPVRLHARFDADAVSDALDRNDVAGISLVPTMLARLLALRDGRTAPAGLEVLLLGGAPIPPELLRRALAAGYPVCPTYGLTEACSQVATSSPPRTGEQNPPPMRPLDGVAVRIVNAARESAAGEEGEIAVRGAVVMQGYLNDSDATARALRDGWLFTGDIGYLDAAGGLHVVDRRDDLVISGGENVYPAEVEAVLVGHPGVFEAGVAGIPDPDLGARVTAWVVRAPGASVDAASLEDFCRTRLAGYKVPREFRFVAALPRTAAGKLQRPRLAGIAEYLTR